MKDNSRNERVGRGVSDFVLAMITLISFFGTFLAPTSGAPVCFVVALSVGFILTELRRILIKLTEVAALAESSPDATAAALRRAVPSRVPPPPPASVRDEPATTAMVRPPAIPGAAWKPPVATADVAPARLAVPVPVPDDSNPGVLDDSAATAMLADLDRKAKPLRRVVKPAAANEAV
jgi:hypothetical protein